MDHLWDLARPTTSAALLVDLAREHGVGLDRCLARTGIDLKALRNPSTEIAARQELVLVENLVSALGDVAGLGLEAGTRYHATTHGLWGFAVLSSPSSRKALQVAINYLELTCSFSRVRVENQANDVRLVVDDARVPSEVRRFLLERDLSGFVTIRKEMFGAAAPMERIDIKYSAPDYADLYERYLGIAPNFEVGANAVTLAAELLDHPLPQANPMTAELCEQQCAQLLDQRRRRLGTSGQVRTALVERGIKAGLADVADTMHISERTLRRRLEIEGTSFRELFVETFETVADELLGAGLTVEDVSERLGYSSAASFTHAFKQWKGTTPGRFARAIRL